MGWYATPAARQAATVTVDADDIGGIVRSAKGPEAGVWVIAETSDLPAGFRKIVVTDEHGRYLVPDLPAGSYTLWVRGYGLVDSPRVTAAPGRTQDLQAIVAPTAQAAAAIYPGSYWFSLLEMPRADEFPGTGAGGNGIGASFTAQWQYVGQLKGACSVCHQMGSTITREPPKHLGSFETSLEAWDRRVDSGQMGAGMAAGFRRLGERRAAFADWTDRIADGEVPPAPPRPSGVERNVVITQWDWAHPHAFIHDLVSTDKRRPTLNAYGPVYAADRHNAPDVSRLDPVRHVTDRPVTIPIEDPTTPFSTGQQVSQPSPYWGEEIIWANRANLHNPMLDEHGRLWVTATVRPPENPAWCTDGALHPSAKLFPIRQSARHAAVYDPKSGQVDTIPTCFMTHHLYFADDADDTLWFSTADAPYIGWLNTRQWDATKDAKASQGWLPFVLDNNGNGRLDAFDEVGTPDEAADPARDKRIRGGSYGIIENPVDGSIWTSASGTPGLIIRVDPATKLSEAYIPPLPGHTTRGIDVDRNGLVWAALNSGHLASFDRRKCAVLNGPTATGRHCPEGWSLHQTPGPNFRNVADGGSADFHYYNFVDQFDTFGLGANTPIANGTFSDALLALGPNRTWVVLRVPYPLGFYTRGMDGRIDDPEGGWKGRGLWASYSSMTPWHYEGGRGATSKAVHFQLRGSPLDR
ncbi:MAG: carboxypeptidase regulatory-like domain-containing protein [Acidimicrobiia bacterium]|nr:carboxypeptidase regulatory-like domain-containing protein [Acidimicrobiia bacterium]